MNLWQCPWQGQYDGVTVRVMIDCFRKMLEEAHVDIISTQQNEERVVLDMTLLVTPWILPSFTLPLTTHLYFEQEEDRQVIYR